MGTTVESVATSLTRRPGRGGALRLADRAARDCLNEAERTSDELDLLINAGVYRGQEPGRTRARCAHPGGHRRQPRPPAGSRARDVLVRRLQWHVWCADRGVSPRSLAALRDHQPGHGRGQRRGSRHVPRLPVPARGRRAPSRPGRRDPGTRRLPLRDIPRARGLFDSRVSWKKRPWPRLPGKLGGRNVLTVREQPGYVEACLDCAQVATEKYAADHGLTIRELDLVVATGPSAEFPDALAEAARSPLGSRRPARARPPRRAPRGRSPRSKPRAPERAARGIARGALDRYRSGDHGCVCLVPPVVVSSVHKRVNRA